MASVPLQPPFSLTAARFPNTPASDKVFGTVELAEAILAYLSFQDLLPPMRACKPFYTIIKTSKAVLRGKAWLSIPEPRTIDASEVPKEDDDDEHDSTSSTAVERDEDEDYLPIWVLPPFKDYVSFIVPKTDDHDQFVIENIGHETEEGALCVGYRMIDLTCWKDTNITITANSTTELWRRVPLTSSPSAIEVDLWDDGGDDDLTTKYFSERTTLGEMYDWLIEEITTRDMVPLEVDGYDYENKVPLDKEDTNMPAEEEERENMQGWWGVLDLESRAQDRERDAALLTGSSLVTSTVVGPPVVRFPMTGSPLIGSPTTSSPIVSSPMTRSASLDELLYEWEY